MGSAGQASIIPSAFGTFPIWGRLTSAAFCRGNLFLPFHLLRRSFPEGKPDRLDFASFVPGWIRQ